MTNAPLSESVTQENLHSVGKLFISLVMVTKITINILMMITIFIVIS